jgi:putative ABC transport system permease protein
MSIIEAIRVAWTSLMTHKGRALLTMLGIIIGVGAVVGMLAIGNGLSQWFRSEFTKLGVGVFYINPQVDSAATDTQQAPQLTAEDAAAIMQPGAVPSVSAVVIEYDGNGVISAGGDRYMFPVKGVTPNFFTVTDNTLGPGRFYSAAEEETRARVAVIGKEVATTLFGSIEGAVGRRITINGVSFNVVGVLTTEASAFTGGFNGPSQMVYVPYQTARARLFRNQLTARVDVSQLTVQARTPEQVNDAIRQTTELLRQRHRLTYQPNDFRVINLEQQAEQAQTALVGLNAFLIVIAGISLLVGGIGIMNIMLVSVAQRTREIGLRKAVGARNHDILVQFLIEAVVLCLTGGALGVAIGYLLSFAGTYVLQNVFRAADSQATVTLGSIMLATAVSTAVGLCFGFFPALRAARLRPIQALRTE